MLGQGRRTTSRPPEPAGTGFPCLSTMAASIPGNGLVALPGFVGITPGTGAIMIEPVSVCHHVSTIGQRPPPITSRYHIHASGLIGSPTEPNKRRLERSCALGHWSPHFRKARMAVGAV